MIFGMIILWISIASFGLASSNEFPVTITSNVTLHGIVCYNQSIELTCHAYGINVTMYKWMSSTGKFIQYYASIIVTVTDDLVEYTYTVTDNRGDHGYSSIDILSNASAPVLYPVNFKAEKTVYVDSTVDLTVQVISNLSLISDPKWSKVSGNLSEDTSAGYY